MAAGSICVWIAVIVQLVVSQRIPDQPQCEKEVDDCEQLESDICLGFRLPYTHTSLVFANDSESQRDVREKLGQWRGLERAPRCWEVVQAFLCAVYLPKCTPGNVSAVELPDYDTCEISHDECQVVGKTLGWPVFLQCDKPHFVTRCVPTLQSVSYNASGSCGEPLIRTENEASWFPDVEGCGIPCENPLFTRAEHGRVHRLIAVLGALCLVCTAFTIMTFVVDWHVAKRYPALILFFINVCFFTGSLGWMAQFLPGIREEIVCKKDGTARQGEPQSKSGESAWCVVVFFVVYFSTIAAFMWFVILAYAWLITFRALGKARETLEPQRAFFHLAAWSVPLVLTAACLTISQVDGDSVSGICFIGYVNHIYRVGFVLVPVGLVLIAGFGLIGAGLVTLAKLQCTRPGLISDRASAKIKETIVRLGVFAVLAFVFIFTTFIVHVYTFVNESKWRESFQQYILCKWGAEGEAQPSENGAPRACEQENRPNLLAVQIHVCAFFGAGIVMSSWVWNKSTLRAWKRAVQRLRKKKKREEPLKVKKHQVIAKAFEKRKEMNAGRLSLSFASNRDDPLGLQFDSISSQEMTSVWTAALPRMVSRRGAMVYPSMPVRRHSDSDLDSMKSLSSLSVARFQAEILRRQSQSRQSQESQSQQESQESDRSRRKRRRHRKKRARNRVLPASTPSPSAPSPSAPSAPSPSVPSAPGTSSLADGARKGSLTSLGTNASLTNVSGSRRSSGQPSSNNTSQVPSSDEGRVTPEPRRPNLAEKKWPAEVEKRQPNVAEKRRTTEPERRRPIVDEVRRLNVAERRRPNAAEPSLGLQRPQPMKQRPQPVKQLPTERTKAMSELVTATVSRDVIHSSDEDVMTPKLKRPPLPVLMQDEEERIRSSDEECVTPELQRPPTACTRVLEVSSAESVHSSDSACATPELKRPAYCRALQVMAITKETKTTTLYTCTVGQIRKSLLDQVELDDLDDLDLVSDLSGSDIPSIPSHRRSQPAKARDDRIVQKKTCKVLECYPGDSLVLDKKALDKTLDKKLLDKKLADKREKPSQKRTEWADSETSRDSPGRRNAKGRRRRREGGDDVIPAKVKRARRKQRRDIRSDSDFRSQNGFRCGQVPRAWTPKPFDCDSEGRSRSPQMSPFQKVKDWMFSPQLAPDEALTSADEPGVDLELSTIVHERKIETHCKKRRGAVNPGYDESEA